MSTLEKTSISAINQGIDSNNPMVLSHNNIYNKLLKKAIPKRGTFYLNPYETTPLAGVMVAIIDTITPIRVRITDIKNSVPVDYVYTPTETGVITIPVIGFAAGTTSRLSVVLPDIEEIVNVDTAPLPPTASEAPEGVPGFPVFEATKPAINPTATISELYYTAISGKYNIGVDYTGNVRWYTTSAILSFAFERLSNGNFITSVGEKVLQEFDVTGRIHRVYNLDNNAHHNIYELPNGHLMLPSELSGATSEDGISIIDRYTGLELAYYDMRNIMDYNRPPVPTIRGDNIDWLHINQVYLEEINNLIVVSARHQGVFAIDAETLELAFIISNHQNWAQGFERFLLTPVDAAGTPLYDFSNPNDIEKADKEFWLWGQHAITNISTTSKGIIEFYVLDNGNYRSRDREKALIPNDNHSGLVHFKVDLSNMTVVKLYEYGKTEIGNRGYSSFVCNQQDLGNNRHYVNFGGGVSDDAGRRRSIDPGDADIIDPLLNDTAQSFLLLQVVNRTSNEIELEITCSSGRYKTLENDGEEFYMDIWSFRSYKLPIIP